MTADLKSRVAKLPTTTGVYFFLDRKGKILYIGKATNLRARVRSYFAPKIEEKRSPLIAKMIEEARDIRVEKTDSVLEALILESALIKKFEPPFNTDEKDQKSWNWVVITNEEFPRVLVMRERELQALSFKLKASFGPYTNGTQLKEALKIVRKIFPFRDRCSPPKTSSEQLSERDWRESEGIFQPACRRGRQKNTPFAKKKFSGGGCFNRQLGLCPGVCTGEISAKDYARNIRHIILFFQGKKRRLITELTKEMKSFAKARDFENADKTKRQIFALQHIQDISLIRDSQLVTHNSNFRIEAYDIAHTSGQGMVGVMVVLENGEPSKGQYRMFKIKNQSGADDTRALREVLERRLKHSEWPLPDLIVADGGIAQLNTAIETLKNSNLPAEEAGMETRPPMRRGLKDKEREEKKIAVVAVTKDEKHKPKEIIGMETSPTDSFWRGSKDGKIIELEKQILLANSEAHRFALSFHKKLRAKAFLPT